MKLKTTPYFGALGFAAATTAILFLLAAAVPTPTSAFFLEWGPDLEGPWCARRPRGQDCCTGRDDYCAVPILGTECYCDVFCNGTAYDCCPDYWSHCHGVERATTTTTPRPVTLPPPRSTRKPLDFTRCELNGVYYQPGDRVKVDNCNECSCKLEPGRDAVFGLQCTNEVCLIRPELIDAVNNGPFTWRASNYSDFWPMTLNYGIQYRLGTYPLESDVLQMTPIKVRQDESLPEMFDARQKWPDRLHPIRDQGDCGASWAFSTTAVAADRLSIESDGAIQDELSAQQMVSCATHGQDGCSGGNVDRAWYFLRKFGVVTEACYPYSSGKTSTQGTCSLSSRQIGGDCPSGVTYNKEKRYKASPPYRIRPTEREIMKEVMDNGPVQAIFEVPEDFFMYKSGVYQYSRLTANDPPRYRKSGYHSVRILGWGVERTADSDIVKYWICANSWGPQWGENGYFRILRGANANNIETFIIGAWGKITGDAMLHQLLTEKRRLRLRERSRRLSNNDDDDDDDNARRLRRRRRRRRRHNHNKKQLRSLVTGRRFRRLRQQKKQQREEARKRKLRQNGSGGVSTPRRERKNKKGRSRHEGRQSVTERRQRKHSEAYSAFLEKSGEGGRRRRKKTKKSGHRKNGREEEGKEEEENGGGRSPQSSVLTTSTTTRMPMLEEVIATMEG